MRKMKFRVIIFLTEARETSYLQKTKSNKLINLAKLISVKKAPFIINGT